MAEGREKTAFVTPYGKYQFRIVWFWLVTAPSTFQRLMDHVLEGIHQFATADLDNVLIYLHHLTTVFQRLRSARLHIKREKCSFAANKCVYLGHVVGRGVVEPVECKVTAVKNYQQPYTKN